jgi:hypothetical protein
MNNNEKLITLARNYCRDNWDYWIDRYQKERTGNNYPYTYTDNDYDLFPRYLKLAAISRGVELLVGRKHKTLKCCVQFLLGAADFKDAAADNVKNTVGKDAIADETRKYREFILSFDENKLVNINVKRLPYKRILEKQESAKIRAVLLHKWGYTGAWYPISSAEKPNHVLFLMTKYVIPAENEIVNFIKSISKSKYYEIRECGNDYKKAIKYFNLSLYDGDGLEKFCCDETFEWAVYGSHESTLTFGGEKLVFKIKELFRGHENKFNQWEL